MDQMKVVLKYFELLCAVQCFSLDSEDDNTYVIRKHLKDKNLPYLQDIGKDTVLNSLAAEATVVPMNQRAYSFFHDPAILSPSYIGQWHRMLPI